MSVSSQTSNNKSQALNLEKIGRITVDQPTKIQYAQNSWFILTASDPSLAEPVETAPEYTVEDLIRDIKEKIKSRGSLGIRGLARMFKILDNNGNRQIDMNEFYWGIKDFGISLTQDEAHKVLSSFDRDRNGTVNFDEFLRALRGDLNQFRINLIK